MLVWSPILAARPRHRNLTGDPPTPRSRSRWTSARKELVITAGPFDLPNMPPMEDHAMMDHGASHDTPIQRFDWPMDGWLRGFELELVDGQGKPVPRDVIHHMIMVNFSRRMLLYSAPGAAAGRRHRDRGHQGPEDHRRADAAGDGPRHVRRVAQRHRQGPPRRADDAADAVDARRTRTRSR